MPAITPSRVEIESGFTDRHQTLSTTQITVTRSSSSTTLLASAQFTNVDPCDLLIIASVHARQSGTQSREGGVYLWIHLDSQQIGAGTQWFGLFGDSLDPYFTYSTHGAIAAVKDVAPGTHTVELRARGFILNGNPTITAYVRQLQVIEFYR